MPFLKNHSKLRASFYDSRYFEPKSRWPTAVLMALKEMLKVGYKLGQGLRGTGHGSPSLINLSDNKGGFKLGYEPTHEELFQASRGMKRRLASPGISFAHIRATFSAPAECIMP